MTLASPPPVADARACRRARSAAHFGASSGRGRARQPLRRPGCDGSAPRRRQRRLLLGPGAKPARSADRRPLCQAAARHGNPLSQRGGRGRHHSGRRSDRPSPLPRRRHSGSRAIDRSCADPRRAAARPPLCRRFDRGGRAAPDRRAGDRLRLRRVARTRSGRRAGFCAA